MNKTISLIRIAILLALVSAGMILLLGEEQGAVNWSFLIRVILDKALGIGCFYVMGKLYGRWRKSDKWLARLGA